MTDYSGKEYYSPFRLAAELSLEEGRRSACAPGSAASGVTLWDASLSSFCFLKAFMMRKFLAPISSMKSSTMSLVFLLEAGLCGFSSPVALIYNTQVEAGADIHVVDLVVQRETV